MIIAKVKEQKNIPEFELVPSAVQLFKKLLITFHAIWFTIKQTDGQLLAVQT